MGFGRTGNGNVDRLMVEYLILDKPKWLDKVAELVKENKLSNIEVFMMMEKIVEKNEEKKVNSASGQQWPLLFIGEKIVIFKYNKKSVTFIIFKYWRKLLLTLSVEGDIISL